MSSKNELHTIRLHGPWQATVVRTDQWDSALDLDSTPKHQKVKIPGNWNDWLGSQFRGVVGYQRSFGLPTNLSDHQEIWLVVERVNLHAEIWLNEECLGKHEFDAEPFRLPVRSIMQARNRLRIEIELPVERVGLAASPEVLAEQSGGGLIGEVRLEIEQDS